MDISGPVAILLFFLLLLALLPIPMRAQQVVTLEQAIELAKQNHPRLKTAAARQGGAKCWNWLLPSSVILGDN